MTTKSYDELQQEVFAAAANAKDADDAWQAQLDLHGVDRYSVDGRKLFKSLYNAKLSADEAMRQANDALRAFRQ